MARVKLSEYTAKSVLRPHYDGVAIHLDSVEDDIARLSPDKDYIIKVDQGVKKRGKQGLLRLNVSANDALQAVQELAERGYTRFLAEPMFAHEESEERYVSFERTRDGIVIQYSEHGGVNVEDNADGVAIYSVDNVPLPSGFVRDVMRVMNEQHLSFVEINPLVVRDDECVLLDAAVLADSAGEYMSEWSEHDVVDAHILTEPEIAIAELNNNSPAAFSFRILNPNGSLWLQMMGGGASITIADEAMNRDKANLIGSFGEYSGGPTTEEVYLYSVQVLGQLLQSKAPRKAFVVAGGVANFSNVQTMFKGVIRALEEKLPELQAQAVRVYVRRGGPNEEEGLAAIRAYLEKTKLYGSVHGSDIVLTDVINEALEYVDA